MNRWEKRKRLWSKDNFNKPIESIPVVLPHCVPWEQLPEEPSKAYKMFKAYRDLGGERSQAGVSRKLKISLSWIHKLAIKFRWDERVNQYDRYLERLKLRAEEHAVLDIKKRQLDIANKFWRIVEAEIDFILKKVELNKFSDERCLSIDQLLRLADFAARTERVNLDEPGEILGVKEVNRKRIQDLFIKKGAQEALQLLSKTIEE